MIDSPSVDGDAERPAGLVNEKGALCGLHACPHVGSLMQTSAVTVYAPTGKVERSSAKAYVPVESGGIFAALVKLVGSPATL